MSNLIEKRLRHTKVYKKYSKTESYITKLLVSDSQAMIKIEPNYVFRGTLFRTQQLPVSSRVTQEFGEYIDDIPVASFKDIFAGKICEALNRQHPRDLFDLKLLLENEGITHDLRQAFVVYLACDSRPMNELLNPNRLDIAPAYRKEFYAMTKDSITLDELKAVRETLI